MKSVLNSKALIISALALVLMGGYLFWTKPSQPTSDLEVQVDLIWERAVLPGPGFAYVRFSPDGKVLAYRDDVTLKRRGEGSIALLDVDALLPREKKIQLTESVGGCTFTNDGLLVAVLKEEICFYDVSTYEIRKRVLNPGRGVLAISPIGDLMVFLDNTERRYDPDPLIQEITTGKRVGGPLRDHGTPWGLPVVFSPCGRYVAFPIKGAIRVVDARTTEQLHTFEVEPIDMNRALCFSPDSRYLAAVFNQDEIRLWDMSTERMAPVCIDWRDAGHPLVIAFSPDGRLIASGGTAREEEFYWKFTTGGTIRLSDARTGALLWSHRVSAQKARPQSPGAVPASFDFSPDGAMLASALSDWTCAKIMLWKVDVKEKAEE